jgi:hypothetical protein
MTITPALASPRTTRAIMNSRTDIEYAQAADPAPKSPSEMRRIFFRPKRSPSRPAGSIAAARTRKYRAAFAESRCDGARTQGRPDRNPRSQHLHPVARRLRLDQNADN